MAKGKKVKKRKVKVDADGVVHIQASFNNIIISLCNRAGRQDLKVLKRTHHMLLNYLPMMLPQLHTVLE